MSTSEECLAADKVNLNKLKGEQLHMIPPPSFAQDAAALRTVRKMIEFLNTNYNKNSCPIISDMLEVVIHRSARVYNYDYESLVGMRVELEEEGLDFALIGKTVRAALAESRAIEARWDADAVLEEALKAAAARTKTP
jgi:hypothetical protein